MNSETLMDCIGQIHDSIIEEADLKQSKNKSAGKHRTMRISAAVICLSTAVFILSQILTAGPSDLPKLFVNTNSRASGSGFEGFLAYDAGELRNGNPWTENNTLETMPVFRNPFEYDAAGAPRSGLSESEMLMEAEKIADIFGLKITSLQKITLNDEDPVFRVSAECRGARIEVSKDGYILLTLTKETYYLLSEYEKLSSYNHFGIYIQGEYVTKGDVTYYSSTGFPMANGQRFAYDISHGQALKITEYLFSKYGAFTKIKEPGFDLPASYTFSGELLRYTTSVFENEGSLTERILNYNFCSIDFHTTDKGGLGGIGYHRTDLSQKIGDYPIITAQEARKLLLENHYITSVPGGFPGEDYIAGTELIYLTDSQDAVFMPYYMFLAELPSMEEVNGLKHFGVFYVPAVQGKYLENMPVWDKSFRQTGDDSLPPFNGFSA